MVLCFLGIGSEKDGIILSPAFEDFPHIVFIESLRDPESVMCVCWNMLVNCSIF